MAAPAQPPAPHERLLRPPSPLVASGELPQPGLFLSWADLSQCWTLTARADIAQPAAPVERAWLSPAGEGYATFSAPHSSSLPLTSPGLTGPALSTGWAQLPCPRLSSGSLEGSFPIYTVCPTPALQFLSPPPLGPCSGIDRAGP
ncbi:hypothetical protein DR999_PMT18889 [Platysternon megacephalum]|uniref:Uncharacterized protein n=1 Tax=Platysternon megacephalum TaxID=55544 RepID=A0A4D9DPB2_9SAUR|nr:hypothetical protein DR999_PMT18889 [Platysternon megacephalum]